MTTMKNTTAGMVGLAFILAIVMALSSIGAFALGVSLNIKNAEYKGFTQKVNGTECVTMTDLNKFYDFIGEVKK